MKAKNKAKVNIFTMLGWLLWKLLALFGSRWARNKLDQHKRDRRSKSTHSPISRGLGNLTKRSRT